MTTDVLIAGAGIVGISTALHLQRRGLSVALIDRRGAGEETSYGNAGLIERASLFPAAFPRGLGDILYYALNRSPQARYHWSYLRDGLPWLLEYWRSSGPAGVAHATEGLAPLLAHSLSEHDALTRGSEAAALYRHDGWIKVYRKPQSFAAAAVECDALTDHGLLCDLLDPAGLAEREPDIAPVFAGGLHMRDPWTVLSPGDVARILAERFAADGGRLLRGDARTLAETRRGWSVATEEGAIEAEAAVVALGPWSKEVTDALGYTLPMSFKRGYHMTYAAPAKRRLRHAVADVDTGFALASMTDGIRLTTGIEFANRDAPPTPRQLDQCERVAKAFFPLGARLRAEPWMGTRPAMSDMLPVIGAAPQHRGLWFCFGHAHLGFTLGPVSGRLVAELVTGGDCIVDPAPYRAERFD